MYLQVEVAGVDVEDGVVVEDVEGHVCQEVSFNNSAFLALTLFFNLRGAG